MRLLVAGCGFVGSALAAARAAGGDEVFGVRRSDAPMPDGVTAVVRDLAVRDGLEDDLPPDLDAVVFAVSADGRDEDAYRRAYVTAAANLLGALLVRGDDLRRAVFVSSTAVYGDLGGGVADETTVTEPTTDTGRVLVEAEARWHGFSVPTTVLRLAGIYGPGRDRLLRTVEAGATCRPGEFTNRIHRDDAAGALSVLLDAERPAPLYVGVDDDPAERCEVYDWLAERLGAPPPARTGDGGGRGGNKRCSNARLRSTGWEPTYPTFREGYAQMLADR